MPRGEDGPQPLELAGDLCEVILGLIHPSVGQETGKHVQVLFDVVTENCGLVDLTAELLITGKGHLFLQGERCALYDNTINLIQEIDQGGAACAEQEQQAQQTQGEDEIVDADEAQDLEYIGTKAGGRQQRQQVSGRGYGCGKDQGGEIGIPSPPLPNTQQQDRGQGDTVCQIEQIVNRALKVAGDKRVTQQEKDAR